MNSFIRRKTFDSSEELGDTRILRCGVKRPREDPDDPGRRDADLEQPLTITS
jgi:hypothetical protein